MRSDSNNAWLGSRPCPKFRSDPSSNSGPCSSENSFARWRRLNSEIYSQNDHFNLVYDIRTVHQFLGTDTKKYKICMLCQHSHPSMAPDYADVQPRNASWIHTYHTFVYVAIWSVSPLWRTGETHPSAGPGVQICPWPDDSAINWIYRNKMWWLVIFTEIPGTMYCTKCKRCCWFLCNLSIHIAGLLCIIFFPFFTSYWYFSYLKMLGGL